MLLPGGERFGRTSEPSERLVLGRFLPFVFLIFVLSERPQADIQALINFCTNHPYSLAAITRSLDHPLPMFTGLYIEALLADEDLADQVWELWNARLISDRAAILTWFCAAKLFISTE